MRSVFPCLAAVLVFVAGNADAGYKMRPGETRGTSSVSQRNQAICQSRARAFQRALPPVITPDPTTPATPAPAPAPSAPPDDRGPRITPPEGTPQPGFNQRAVRTFQTSEAAAPAPEQPSRSIRDEYLERIERSRDLPYTRTTIWTPAPAASAGSSGGSSGVSTAADPFAWAQPASGLHNRDQGGRPEDPNAKSKR